MKLKTETIKQIKKAKSWFFSKISRICKLLTKLRKRDKTQITNIKNERSRITMHSIDIKRRKDYMNKFMPTTFNN